MKTFVIAEIGSAWRFGKYQLSNGKQAIEVAKAAGADALKMQWCHFPRLMEKRRKVKKHTYDLLCWDRGWMKIFAAECERFGIEFMCTVYLPEDVEVIAPFVKRFKVASLEAFDTALVQAEIDTKRQVIISLGAQDSKDYEQFAPPTGWIWKNVKLLQCTCAYPAPPASMNLRTIGKCYDIEAGVQGLSDHSGDLLTGALAVACGAEIIEVHFRLSRTPKDNPDYGHSHSPERLRQYINNIRRAEIMLGDGIKKVEECERPMLRHRVST